MKAMSRVLKYVKFQDRYSKWITRRNRPMHEDNEGCLDVRIHILELYKVSIRGDHLHLCHQDPKRLQRKQATPSGAQIETVIRET